MRVEPNAVYVIPPNTELTVNGGVLRLAEPSEPRGMRLAHRRALLLPRRGSGRPRHRSRLIGHGVGRDARSAGDQDARRLTLAQEPHSAQFDSMPKSAIAAGAADIVGLAADLPQRILLVIGAQPWRKLRLGARRRGRRAER
jgi:two-component system, chemotaxis family, CheB/CheR fusion protein